MSIGASLMSPPGADTVDQEFALPLDGLFVVFEEATGGGNERMPGLYPAATYQTWDSRMA